MSSFDVQVQVEEMLDVSYADWMEYQRFADDQDQAEIDEINAMLSVAIPTPAELDEMAKYFAQA